MDIEPTTRISPAHALPGAPAHSDTLRHALEAARAELGARHVPRTRHHADDGSPRYTNRLLLETSPYLLQHAHNPVNWFPWCNDAFDRARSESRPVFLSIGYATCHWCHVMEHESFEDEELAETINRWFVPIKVDREERPDVDRVYMTAVQLATHGGGWPMTVVLTPDRRPFFAGTYFPARDGDRLGSMGLLTILRAIAKGWEHNRDALLEDASRLSNAVIAVSTTEGSRSLPSVDALDRAKNALAARYDRAHGGFGGAPKFPQPSTYEFLLRYARRTGSVDVLPMITHSLSSMADGGICDQVGGGFHRYATDGAWSVPHFEKMLYDNAQLSRVLVDAFRMTGMPRFAEIARDTLDYVLREMTSPDGGFFSATDADSEGEEGRFFTWTLDEFEAVLGRERARIAASHFGITSRGDIEGRSVLRRARALEDLAREFGRGGDAIGTELAETRRALFRARNLRPRPLLDDKILTEWNAQMISALARAAFALGEARYERAAIAAATFLRAHLVEGDRVLRAHRHGRARHTGVLEDYAFFIEALLDLFEVTSDVEWFDLARVLAGTVERLFSDAEHGGYFETAVDAERLLVRSKPFSDGAQPSGNGIHALNLIRLAAFTDDRSLRECAEKTIACFRTPIERGAIECPSLASALEALCSEFLQIAIVATAKDDGASLVDVMRKAFLPNRAFVLVRETSDHAALARRLPFLVDKRALDGRATAYVCRGHRCLEPTSNPAVFAAQLS